MSRETWRVRLIAFGVAVACLGLAFGFVTGLPGILMLLLFAGAFVLAPLLVVTQGWLGIWLLALGGMWAMGLMSIPLRPYTSGAEIGLAALVLMGLSALYIAIIPPHIAARRRAAWPFGHLNPHRAALKAKRDRLLYEEEIIYDAGRGRWERGWDADDADDAEDEALPLARKRNAAR